MRKGKTSQNVNNQNWQVPQVLLDFHDLPAAPAGSEAVSERPLVDSVPREGLVAAVGFLGPVELVPPAAEEIEPRA